MDGKFERVAKNSPAYSAGAVFIVLTSYFIAGAAISYFLEGVVSFSVSMAIAQIFFVVLPGIILSKKGFANPANQYGLRQKFSAGVYAATLVGVLACAALIAGWTNIQALMLPDFLESVYTKLIESQKLMMNQAFGDYTLAYYLPAIISLALLPAIGEEILFRGYLLSSLRSQFTPLVSVVLCSAFFAAAHVNPAYFLPIFFLGLFFGILTIRTGGILPAMFAHFVNNAVSVSAEFFESVMFPGGAGDFSAPFYISIFTVIAGGLIAIFMLKLAGEASEKSLQGN